MNIRDRMHLAIETTKEATLIFCSRDNPDQAPTSISEKWPQVNITRYDVYGANVALGLVERRTRLGTGAILVIDRDEHRAEITKAMNESGRTSKHDIMLCDAVSCNASSRRIRQTLIGPIA